MLTQEALSSVYGAWRLLLGDRTGMRHFNSSHVGFWRSFTALAVIFPVICGLRILAASNTDVIDNVDWARYAPVQVIEYVIRCAGFPLLMFYIADMLDRREKFTGFVAAYNWSSIVQIGILTPAALMAYSNVLPDGIGQFVLQVAWIGTLVYSGYIARVALDIGFFVATGVVVGDLLFTKVVIEIATWISLGPIITPQ